MSTARGFLGSGDLYINRIIGGVKQGMEGPFEAEKFEIKANSDLREKTSKSKSNYGGIVASASVPKPFDLSVTMGEVDKTGLSIALMGTAAALNQASGTLTAADVVADSDKWVPLTKARLTGAMTLTNTGATVTYVEGEDYVVNRELGLVKCLSAGDITDAQALKVTSTYGAITATEIIGGTSTSIRAELTLDGKNLADDTPCICTVYEGVIASDAAIDFLSDNFLNVPLPGRMVTPVGKTGPFSVVLRNAAA